MNIVALAGGVGGAKLADGFAQILAPEEFTVIVNTGDDFEHLGLYISPDVDTVCYTLAGLANPVTGWGQNHETYRVMESIEKLGGPGWFRLGDKDMATHIERTRLLNSGLPLSKITQAFCKAWGVFHKVLPMSDEPIRTMVCTEEYGELPFQEYFVHQNCEPVVKGFRFSGIENAQASPGVIEAIRKADAIVLCPSNPWVSIDPILAINGLRINLAQKKVLAVSPIVGGLAVKGPAAKMFLELGITPSASAIALHYKDLLSGLIVDVVDSSLAKDHSIPITITNTIMRSQNDRRQLAQDVLDTIQTIKKNDP